MSFPLHNSSLILHPLLAMRNFYKYTALGNDMIVIDPARCAVALSAETIRRICDRHFGVGADGICYGPLPDSPLHVPTMRFFNPDGSEAEKSGNGMRIFARYLWDAGYVTTPEFNIGIKNEVVSVRTLHETATEMAIGMGQLIFAWEDEEMEFGGQVVRATAVSIGNPHCVIITEELQKVHPLGPIIESAPQFPQRTNVQFVEIIDQQTIQIEIWERGAGYTLASGTSTCAAAGTAVKLGYCHSPVTVHMPGGTAVVEIDKNWSINLIGTVAKICDGTFASEFLGA